MKIRYLLPLLLLGVIGPGRVAKAQSKGSLTPNGAGKTAGAGRLHARASYAALPISFEPCFEAMCTGTVSQATYFSRGSGYLLFLSSAEAVFEVGTSKKSTLRIKLLRSNSRATIEGMDPLPGKSNYFIGTNRRSWRSNVTNYAKVRHRNVYRGVDLVYYGNGSQLEYDFVVAAGADPREISLTFPGARSVSVDQGGDLVLTTERGKIVQRKPRVWQQAGETKKEIEARYAIRNENEIGFDLGRYDASAPLVIDPVLVYSTLLDGFAGAVDGAGNVYVSSSDGARGTLLKKLDTSGMNAIYSTDIGGASSFAIALDATGNVYVTGFAYTPDFPVTPGAFQTQIVSAGAPFVAKVNDTGSLVYATFLSPSDGASLAEDPQGPPFVLPCCLAVDSAGSAYVTGTTRSKNFPTTPGAFQTHWDAGWSTFVTKLNPTGTGLAYSTYLGGSGPGALLTGMSQEGTGISVDAAGNAYVAGWTGSSDFPTTPGALQFPGTASYGGFVSKLNPSGSSLIYSTFLRQALPTNTVTVDAAGNAYVAGFNLAGQFPLTPGAFDDGGNDWLAKLNPAGTALVYAAHVNVGGKITVDADGNAYFAGSTSSPDFPTTPGALQKVFAGGDPVDECGSDSDAFVTKLNAAGTALIYSTYLGGKRDDGAQSIGLDAGGKFYVAGGTDSPDFPITVGAPQVSPAGSSFLAKLDLPSAAVIPSFQPSSVVNAASFVPGPVAPGEIVTVFGTGFGPGPLTRLQLTAGLVNTTLGGTRILFDGVPAPIIYTVENQFSAVVPYEVAGNSSTQVQVEYRGTRSAPVTLQLAPASPAIFTLDSSGRGQGAILNQDSSVNSPANPAHIGSVVSIFATGEGQTSPGGVDGKPGSDPAPHPILPVTVNIGGQTVTPIHAGGAPGSVAGVMQVNVQIPAGIQTGSAVPVQLQVGNLSSEAGVTIAVQ